MADTVRLASENREFIIAPPEPEPRPLHSPAPDRLPGPTLAAIIEQVRRQTGLEIGEAAALLAGRE